MVAKVNTSTEDEEISESGGYDGGGSDGYGGGVDAYDGGGSGGGSPDIGRTDSSDSRGNFSSGSSLVNRAIKFAKEGVPFAGGNITPAKIGSGYGAKWSMNFSEGGKVSSASKRADGIAQRGKTKGRYL
jgi:hypothetical protein